jgi:hypothetical protein
MSKPDHPSKIMWHPQDGFIRHIAGPFDDQMEALNFARDHYAKTCFVDSTGQVMLPGHSIEFAMYVYEQVTIRPVMKYPD